MACFRFNYAGIAIGPILFIVAIIAVLVAALSSGNNGFSNTSAERYRTRVAPLIQQGVNFKMATETLMTYGITESQLIVSQSFSTASGVNALFAPTGGTLIPQIPPIEVTGTGASWVFAINQNMEGLGVAANNDVVAYIQIINAAMCKIINQIVFGPNDSRAVTLPVITATVVANAVTAQNGVIDTTNVFNTSGVSTLSGRMQACVADSATTPNYWYYQVMRVN